MLIDRLIRALDPLYGASPSTREAFAAWYLQARLPQIRYVAFLTMALYLIYAGIEQNVAADALHWRLFAHAGVVPLALLAVGLLSYRRANYSKMLLVLCISPVFALVSNLLFNSRNADFAYYSPEIYLTLVWIFAISGLTLKQALLTASVSLLAVLAFTLTDALQPGVQRLHGIWLLASFSFGLLCAYMLEKAHKRMFLQQNQLALSASIDGLTGLWNRARIEQLFSEEIIRAQRYDTRFAIILIDIDHFKLVNDNHGHAVGDAVLRQFASLLSGNVRAVDRVGRWGGEEFLVLLPEVGVQQAMTVARTLQSMVRECEFTSVGHKTASFGVTEYLNDQSVHDMLERADRALYQAKASGRDRIALL